MFHSFFWISSKSLIMFHLHGCCGSADIESINYLVVNRPQLLQRPKNHHQLFSGNFSYVSSAPLKVHQILTLQEPCHVRFLYFLQTNVSILQRAEFFKSLLDRVAGAIRPCRPGSCCDVCTAFPVFTSQVTEYRKAARNVMP